MRLNCYPLGRALLLASLLAGCGLGDGEVDGPTWGEADAGAPGGSQQPQAITVPLLDPVQGGATCADTIAVTGRAAPGVTVIGVGMAGSEVTVAQGQTGRFCLPMRLVEGLNNISVYVNHDGRQSEAANQSITRQPGCANNRPITRSAAGTDNASPALRPLDRSAFQSVTSSIPPVEGAIQLLYDGEVTAPVVFTTAGIWAADEVELIFELNREYELGGLVAFWKDSRDNGGYAYARGYDISVAPAQATSGQATAPPPGTDTWIVVATRTDAAGGSGDRVTFQPVKTRRLRLRLQEDGHLSWNEEYGLFEVKLEHVVTSSSTGGGSTTTPPPITATGVCVGY